MLENSSRYLVSHDSTTLFFLSESNDLHILDGTNLDIKLSSKHKIRVSEKLSLIPPEEMKFR